MFPKTLCVQLAAVFEGSWVPAACIKAPHVAPHLEIGRICHVYYGKLGRWTPCPSNNRLLMNLVARLGGLELYVYFQLKPISLTP